jgi:prepilin-type N-terminal cleavage/methylation domain-containing protein
MKRIIKKIKGFTLIELLLVIAILGILIALLLPRFEDVRTTANTRVCVGNLRGLANAMAVYETAKNNPNIAWGSFTPNSLVSWQYLATQPLEPYGTGTNTYALVTNAGDTPDRASCRGSNGSAFTDHVWP